MSSNNNSNYKPRKVVLRTDNDIKITVDLNKPQQTLQNEIGEVVSALGFGKADLPLNIETYRMNMQNNEKLLNSKKTTDELEYLVKKQKEVFKNIDQVSTRKDIVKFTEYLNYIRILTDAFRKKLSDATNGYNLSRPFLDLCEERPYLLKIPICLYIQKVMSGFKIYKLYPINVKFMANCE